MSQGPIYGVENNIIDFPLDVLVEILSKLPNFEIAQFCQTNPHLNTICQNNRLWRQKFINDFPGLNEYHSDLISYLDAYKTLIKPLTRIKDIFNADGNRSAVYAESLGNVYLSFLVHEEDMDNFMNQLEPYLTPNSVIVMINSDADPLIMVLNKGARYDWFKFPNENNVIKEVLIIDMIMGFMGFLKRYIDNQSIIPDSHMTEQQFDRIMHWLKLTIPRVNERKTLEQAQARLAQMIKED